MMRRVVIDEATVLFEFETDAGAFRVVAMLDGNGNSTGDIQDATVLLALNEEGERVTFANDEAPHMVFAESEARH
jgi:hypothetical protein